MSYDLDLVPADHGGDVGDWLEAAAVDVEAAAGHLATIHERFPDFEPFGPTEFGYELTAPDESELPVQVGFYGTHASMNVPYWDLGERTEALGRLVVEIASAIHEATGWVVYDPQEDRIVGLDELAAVFGAGQRHGVGLVARIAEENAPEPQPSPKPEPKRKRFLGLF